MAGDTRAHDPSGHDQPVEVVAAGGTPPAGVGPDPVQGGEEHGLRRRAGAAGMAGGATTPPDATRYLETSLGILSYAELAPHLANRVAVVEQAIAEGDYSALPVDEHLILRFHADVVTELVPAFGGHWRTVTVTVGEHTPPPPHEVPLAMREYARDLLARMASRSDADASSLLELLAFAEGRLLSIHPFQDFNGRATRVFLAELLRRLELPPVDPTPPDGLTRRYLAALRAGDRLDWGPLKELWRVRLQQDVSERHDVCLTGCSPTPLASYLKALGILRLVAKEDPEAQGWWQGEHFWIRSRLDMEGLTDYFLNRYEPTPVLSPWNAGSGFYFRERKAKEKDPATGKRVKLGVRDEATEATRAVQALIDSTSARLAAYREALEAVRNRLRVLGFEEAPKEDRKDHLAVLLRNTLPHSCLEWLDASVSVSLEGTRFPPLLGSGGNDGNLDFSSNFMQRIVEVVDTRSTTAPDLSGAWLRQSLSGAAVAGLVDRNVGQFSPGQVGRPVNPWDFVLMIEGSLCFASATVRRLSASSDGALGFPFTVRALSAGSGSLGAADAGAARGEMWMPLWRHPVGHSEIRALLSEGLVAVGRHAARDALDFNRAVHRLGGARGVNGYQRFGFIPRNGDAHFAASLARVSVGGDVKTTWTDDLERAEWLDSFRRWAQGPNAAKRAGALRRRLEDALFDAVGRDMAPVDVQALLVLLGEVQAELSRSTKAMEVVPPVPALSERWVESADDGSVAFRIARSLAGLSGTGDMPLPLAAQLFPIHPRTRQWLVIARKSSAAASDPLMGLRLTVDAGGTLVEFMTRILTRRLWAGRQLGMADRPLGSHVGVGFDDLLAFLRSDRMDARIAALTRGLSLCRIPPGTPGEADHNIVPAAYSLIKLCVTQSETLRRLGCLREGEALPTPPGLVALLTSGRGGERAVKLAWRRLRASGLSPLFSVDSLPELDSISARRAAASLLIPLRLGATAAMARSVLRPIHHKENHDES